MKPAGGRAANDKFVALTILCGEALFPGEQKTEKDTGAEEIINPGADLPPVLLAGRQGF